MRRFLVVVLLLVLVAPVFAMTTGYRVWLTNGTYYDARAVVLYREMVTIYLHPDSNAGIFVFSFGNIDHVESFGKVVPGQNQLKGIPPTPELLCEGGPGGGDDSGDDAGSYSGSSGRGFSYSGSSRSRSTGSSAAKTQRVSGYTRKSGTHVDSYKRRPASR